MGNNGIWALEKHPMEFLYGYSVAAELRPETRYDQVVEALGGHGELVRAAGRAARRAGARVRGGQAGARERADRPDRRLPAQVQPRLSAASASKRGSRPHRCGRLPQSGPIRTGRGTCHERAYQWLGRREAPSMRLRPSLCAGQRGRLHAPTARRPPYSEGVMHRTIEHTSSSLVRVIRKRASQVAAESRCSSAALRRIRRSARRDVRSATPCRMSCSETSTRSSPNARRTSIRIATPATIVGARSGCRPRHLAPLGERHLREAREQQLERRRARAR